MFNGPRALQRKLIARHRRGLRGLRDASSECSDILDDGFRRLGRPVLDVREADDLREARAESVDHARVRPSD